MSKPKDILENDFFGTADYTIPETSNYMKFKEGDNTFRVLSSAVTGFEYYKADNKPVRSKTEFESTPDIKVVDGKPTKVNHFWSFIVWNYDAKRVQVLTITQKALMKYMKGLIDNPKWGSPRGYDFTVNKVGSGLATEYTFTATPHSPIDLAILEKYSKMSIDLEALFRGEEVIK